MQALQDVPSAKKNRIFGGVLAERAAAAWIHVARPRSSTIGGLSVRATRRLRRRAATYVRTYAW
jgi:hypothetical protein